jgi:hypothetical protein
MKGCAIVATHHKTGTAWMSSTFQRICKVRKICFHSLDRSGPNELMDCNVPTIFFSSHSNFEGFTELQSDNYPVFHLIRDPRDVLISGMHYHRKAKEKWLFAPQAEFGNIGYQEKLNSFAIERRRLQFELDYSATRTIAGILRWNYNQSRSFECRYENLIQDTEGMLFASACAHLGFGPKELARCKGGFLRNSIFAKKSRLKGKTTHVRSGDAQQWRSVFDKALAKSFEERFPGALIKLGYEKDASWIEQLPDTNERLDLTTP